MLLTFCTSLTVGAQAIYYYTNIFQISPNEFLLYCIFWTNIKYKFTFCISFAHKAHGGKMKSFLVFVYSAYSGAQKKWTLNVRLPFMGKRRSMNVHWYQMKTSDY